MKTYKLKVKVLFKDTSIAKKRFPNEVFECSEDRAKEILNKIPKYVEILSIKKDA